MQLFYEMVYSCSGEECCKITNKRFEWAKKYFCVSDSHNNEPAVIDNVATKAQKDIISETNSDISLKGIMNPFLPQPYITCTNLLYATCFLIVQLFIVALHFKRRK